MSPRNPRPPTVSSSDPLSTLSQTRADVARRRLAQLAATFEERESTGDGTQHPAVTPQPSGRHRAGRAPTTRSVPSVGAALRLAPAHLRAVTGVSVCIAIVLVWWLLAQRPQTADVDAPVRVSGGTSQSGGTRPVADEASPSVGVAADPTELVVDVGGQVRRPGLTTLPPGSRVADAIKAAGGLKGRVDTSALNLARPVVDGEQILVGVRSADQPAGSGGAAAGAGGGAGTTVNLNSATIEQLDELPGVGPVTAQSILDWRTENGRFASVEDLLDVSGIGDKTFADLRDLVTV